MLLRRENDSKQSSQIQARPWGKSKALSVHLLRGVHIIEPFDPQYPHENHPTDLLYFHDKFSCDNLINDQSISP